MVDTAHLINSVRRSLGTRTLEAGEARVLTISQVYDTDPEDLWDACTSPTRIPRWFLPVSGELRLGGRYKLEGNAEGTIESCDPPKRFSATWEYGGEVSWIDVRIHAEPDGKARFELEHVAPVDEERWSEFGPAAVGIGWDMGLYGLAQHIAGGAPALDPAAVAEWMQGDEYRELVALSSERWYEADVAAGADPAAARGAADRTAAAYTATPETGSDT
jgi:uncharacterized protein YndB with AHSA1/START domain